MMIDSRIQWWGKKDIVYSKKLYNLDQEIMYSIVYSRDWQIITHKSNLGQDLFL